MFLPSSNFDKGYTHDATRLLAPVISTTHIRHAPIALISFNQQRVGILMPFYQLCATSRTSILHTFRIRSVRQAYVRICSHTRSSTLNVRVVQPVQEDALSVRSQVQSSSLTPLTQPSVSSAVLVWLSVSSVLLLRNDPV